MSFTAKDRIKYWKKRTTDRVDSARWQFGEHMKEVLDNCEHICIDNNVIKQHIVSMRSSFETLKQYIRDAEPKK